MTLALFTFGRQTGFGAERIGSDACPTEQAFVQLRSSLKPCPNCEAQLVTCPGLGLLNKRPTGVSRENMRVARSPLLSVTLFLKRTVL